MKYNKSEIMKNAWAIRRRTNGTMSIGMRASWAFEKAHNEADVFGKETGWNYRVVVRDWARNGSDRTYIAVRVYTNAWNLKREYTMGYINNLTGEFIADGEVDSHVEAEKETAKAEAATLPALKGSEKQVSWANDLRKNAVNVLEWMRKNPSNEGKKDMDLWEKGVNFVESKLNAVEYAAKVIDALKSINFANDPEKIAVSVVRNINKYC